MKPQHIFLVLLIIFIWALNFVILKPCLVHVPPLALMSIRFFCVAAILIPLSPFPYGAMRKLFELSLVLGVLHFGLIFMSLAVLDAGTVSVATQLSVPFATLLSIFIFKEKLSKPQFFGIIIAFVGVMVMSFDPKLLRHLGALGVGVLAAFFWAFSSIQVKKLSYLNHRTVTGWFSLFAATELMILSLAIEGYDFGDITEAPLSVYGGLFYTVIFSTVIAYSLWYKMIALYPITKVVPYMLLNPVFGLSMSALFLGEALTIPKIIGASVTLLGVALITLVAARKKA